MKIDFHPSGSRGYANHGWLKARHSFSFASWFNPSRVHFGMLRVLNDDIVAPSSGFGMHPHDNMEIVTIPLHGALRHQDNQGNEGVIRTGDVQVMSAGTGIYHSEFNDSHTEEVQLFQTWVFPREKNLTPRYDQRTFGLEGRQGKWQTLVAPNQPDTLMIHQDAWFSMADMPAGSVLPYDLHGSAQGLYLMVVSGKIEVGGQILNARDAAGISQTQQVEINVLETATLLAIEVPMH